MKKFNNVNSQVKRLKSMQDKMSEVVNAFKEKFGNTEVFVPTGKARACEFIIKQYTKNEY